MIKHLRLVNWKSHKNSEFAFDRGTNVLVGIMGSGKTSVIEAITFALFGKVPGNRKVEELIMRKPKQEREARIELKMTLNGREIEVRRIIKRDKREAYLYINGSFITGPGQRDVNEYLEQELGMDYELFTRAIYSPQNRLDYFLNLTPKERKKNLDNLLGLERFETIRANTVKMITKLKTLVREIEKERMAIDLKGLEKELDEIENEIKEIEEEVKKLKSEEEKERRRIEKIEGEIEKLEMKKRMIEELEKRLREIEAKMDEKNRMLEELKVMMEKVSKEQVNEELEKKRRMKGAMLEKMRIKKELERKRREIQGEMAGIEKILKGFTPKELDECERRIGELEELLNKLSGELRNLEEEKYKGIRELNRMEVEIGKLEKEGGELEVRIKVMEEKLKQIEEITDGKGKEGVEKEKRELEEKIKEKELDLIRVRAEIKNEEKLKDALERCEKICPICGSKMDEERKLRLMEEKERKLSELRKKESEVSEKLRMLDLELKRINGVLSEIERIEKEIEDPNKLKKRVEEIQIEIKELNKGIGVLKNKIGAIERMLEEKKKEKEKLLKTLFEEKKRRDEISRDLNLKSKLVLLRKEMKEVEEELEKLREVDEQKLIEIERALVRLENTLRYYKLCEEIEELQRKREELLRRMEEIEFDEKELKALKDELSNLKEKLASLSERIKGREELLKEKGRLLERLRGEVRKAKEVSEKLERARSLLSFFLSLENAVKKAQVRMREELLNAINQYMDLVWHELYPYRDLKSIRLRASENDYVLEVQEKSGEWVRVEGLVSGGERAIAALTLRIALSLVLTPNLNWLILDEPTHNLDENGVLELAKVLRDVLPRLIDQIFIITHNPLLKEAASASLYLLERRKELDEPTNVHKLL